MNFKEIIKGLKADAHRLTKIRKSLITLFTKDNTPIPVTEIMEKLVKVHPKVNKTTIYREIKFLKQKNIIEEIELGDGKKRYELVENHHHHLICIKCKRVEDIKLKNDLEYEKKDIQKNKNFKVINHMLEFFGICKQCQF